MGDTFGMNLKCFVHGACQILSWGEKAFADDNAKLKRSLGPCHFRNVVDCVSLDGVERADYICEFSTLGEDRRRLGARLGSGLPWNT